MAKILIVEDNELFLNRSVKCLLDAGFQADHAKNGKEALLKITEQKYDAFIVNLIMPEISGIELLKNIRASQLNKDSKVIITSGFSDKEIAELIYSLGANYVLDVPVSPETLISKINLCLSRQ